ncbi:MAG: HEAT repeat domain-containing protein [Acidiferrobacteraceae bacterium]
MIGIAQIINPALLRIILLRVIEVMAAFLVVLFAILVVQKLAIERRERHLKRLRLDYLRRLTPPYSVLPPPHTDIEFEAMGVALADRIRTGTSHERRELQQIVRRFAVDTFYERRARGRSWTRRIGAMEALASFALPESRPFVIARLQREKDQRVLSKAVVTLSLVAGALADLELVTDMLLTLGSVSSKFNEFVYTNCIRSLRAADHEGDYVQALKSAKADEGMPWPLKRDMIEAAGKAGLAAARGIIASFYRYSGDALMRVTCLRALGNLEGLGQIMNEALMDDDWRVRAVAVRYGFQGGADAMPLVKRALRDENYYVRLNAGVTMMKFGASGFQALCEEAEGPDPFAREIAYYAMNAVPADA